MTTSRESPASRSPHPARSCIHCRHVECPHCNFCDIFVPIPSSRLAVGDDWTDGRDLCPCVDVGCVYAEPRSAENQRWIDEWCEVGFVSSIDDDQHFIAWRDLEDEKETEE